MLAEGRVRPAHLLSDLRRPSHLARWRRGKLADGRQEPTLLSNRKCLAPPNSKLPQKEAALAQRLGVAYLSRTMDELRKDLHDQWPLLVPAMITE